jgi:hypothetical protein
MDFSETTPSAFSISEHTKQLKMDSLYQQVIDAFLFSAV